MRYYSIYLLLFLLHNASLGLGQQVPEKLIYQLAESVLDEDRQEIINILQQRAQGRAYLGDEPYTPKDTIAIPKLLLDHVYLRSNLYPMVDSVTQGSESKHAVLLKYFSAADLAYMRRQLPSVTRFEFEQAKFRLLGVKVISFDTLIVLRERVSKQLGVLADILAEHQVRDTLLTRYGSRKLYGIACPLLSRNHKRAIILIGHSEGRTEVCVYRRGSGTWRKEQVISRIYHN